MSHCQQETIVAVEQGQDEDGDPTSERFVAATCNGNLAQDCGWSKRLSEFDKHPEEWWVTSSQMVTLHAAHRAGSTR